jgi:hypothetical protein
VVTRELERGVARVSELHTVESVPVCNRVIFFSTDTKRASSEQQNGWFVIIVLTPGRILHA